MLEKEGDKIDAVTIGIPDHMHAIATLDALRGAKTRLLSEALDPYGLGSEAGPVAGGKSGVITRMGNQIHSHGFYRTAVRLVQSGAIENRRVHSGSMRRGMVSPGKSDAYPSPPPKGLAWDLWLGVACTTAVGEGLPSLGVAGLAGFRERGFGRLRLPFWIRFSALKIEQAPTRIKCSMHTGMNDEVGRLRARSNTISRAPRFRKSRSRSPGTTGGENAISGPISTEARPAGRRFDFHRGNGFVGPPASGRPSVSGRKVQGLAYERMENLNHFMAG